MYKLIKRAFDIIISFLGILVVFLPSICIAILIKCGSKGPIFYKQERIGKNLKVFRMLKFRTMYLNAESSGVYESKNDPRVTKIGKILRKTSLDEIPQLLNVLAGQMSLIGPRPPLTYHPWPINEYTEEQKRMFTVRPGLTGYAQINGRKDVEWNKRIQLNIFYVDNCSLKLDLKIFFKTIKSIFKNENNYNTKETVKK